MRLAFLSNVSDIPTPYPLCTQTVIFDRLGGWSVRGLNSKTSLHFIKVNEQVTKSDRIVRAIQPGKIPSMFSSTPVLFLCWKCCISNVPVLFSVIARDKLVDCDFQFLTVQIIVFIYPHEMSFEDLFWFFQSFLRWLRPQHPLLSR